MKVAQDNEFIINILSELFAYEIFVQALEIGLDKMNIDAVYSLVHTEFNHSNFKKQIYDKAEYLLEEKYNIRISLK